MSIIKLKSPDLQQLSDGVTTLHMLEGLGFSNDGNTLLVRATFTDNATGGTLHYGVWTYDLVSNSYTSCVNSLITGSDSSAKTIEVYDAKISGSDGSSIIVAQSFTKESSKTDSTLSLIKNGVASLNDTLKTLVDSDININIEQYSLSNDGRFVAIQTDSANLSPENSPDTNDSSDVYLLDLLTNHIERISYVGNSEVNSPVYLGNVLSYNGFVQVSFVTQAVFTSKDKNSSLALEAQKDAYLWSSKYDSSGLTGARSFSLVSSNTQGEASGYVDPQNTIMATKRGVFYSSTASDIISNDTNNSIDSFIKEPSSLSKRVPLSPWDELIDGESILSASINGDFVAMLSSSKEVTGSDDGIEELLMVDLDNKKWHVVSKNSNNELANDTINNGVMSPTGNLIAFTTAATNLANNSEDDASYNLFVVNEAPIITSIATANIAENSSDSTVLYTAIATDVDASTTFTYSLSGDDASLLNINSTSGEVTLKTSANYETKNSYSFNVIASDGVFTDTKAITASVTNVNEGRLRYFISGTGSDLTDLRSTIGSYNPIGETFVLTGNSLVNTVYATSGVVLDARNLLGGTDTIFFSSNWGDYTKDISSISGAIVFTNTDSSTGLVEKVIVSNGGTALGRDKLVFADGAIMTNIANSALKTTLDSTLNDLGNSWNSAITTHNPGVLLPTTTNATERVFLSASAEETHGAVFAASEIGMHYIVTGSSKPDDVYVATGATVDARSLLGGTDTIYLTGKWSDYYKNITKISGAIEFTRDIGNSIIETIIVSNGGTSLGKDKVVFSDGTSLTNNINTALKNNLNALTNDISNWNLNQDTPGNSVSINSNNDYTNHNVNLQVL